MRKGSFAGSVPQPDLRDGWMDYQNCFSPLWPRPPEAAEVKPGEAQSGKLVNKKSNTPINSHRGYRDRMTEFEGEKSRAVSS